MIQAWLIVGERGPVFSLSVETLLQIWSAQEAVFNRSYLLN